MDWSKKVFREGKSQVVPCDPFCFGDFDISEGGDFSSEGFLEGIGVIPEGPHYNRMIV